MSTQTKIALVDDHHLFREGIKHLLKGITGVELTMESGNGKDFLMRVDEVQPDVLLLDLEMPTLNGLDTLKELKGKNPDGTNKHVEVSVIVLTMHEDMQMISYAMEIGASGYLLKDTTLNELANAIKSVTETGFYFNSSVSQALLSGVKSKSKKPMKLGVNLELTRREEEVLELVCQEMTTGEIAEKLFISKRTVEGHRKNLTEKFGVKNTAGLIMKAIKWGFIKV